MVKTEKNSNSEKIQLEKNPTRKKSKSEKMEIKKGKYPLPYKSIARATRALGRIKEKTHPLRAKQAR